MTPREIEAYVDAAAAALNLPLSKVHAASLRTHADGTGEIALQLLRGVRVGYFLTWPHVRPFHYLQPQPSLRALPGATQAVADEGTFENAQLIHEAGQELGLRLQGIAPCDLG